MFPPVSKLDPEIDGPQKSALREEHISGQLDGMTVQQVIVGFRIILDETDYITLFTGHRN